MAHSRLYLLLSALAVMPQLEDPGLMLGPEQRRLYSHAQLATAAWSEADGAALVSDALKYFAERSNSQQLRIAAAQLPVSWQPRGITITRVPDTEIDLCGELVRINQISRDARQAMVSVIHTNRCEGRELSVRYDGGATAWRRAAKQEMFTFSGASSCGC